MERSLYDLILNNPEYNSDALREFEKRIADGGKINFKDENSDTTLHLAVHNKTPAWVRLLLERGADKTILNDDKKSPLNLAQEQNLTELVSLLSDAFERIDVKSIHVIDFKLRENPRNETADNPLCKIVKITNCSKVVEAIQFITDLSFYKLFNASPFLFIIIIHGLEPDSKYDFPFFKLDSVFKKPMIIQLSFGDKSLLFHKESSDKAFQTLSIDRSLIFRDLEYDVHNADTFNFELLIKLQHLKPNEFGRFSYDLEQTEFNTKADVGGAFLIDYAAQYKNILCLMYIKLFNVDLEQRNVNCKRTLELAVESGSLEVLKILLDVPTTCDEGNSLLDQRRLEIIHLPDIDGSSLLVTSIVGRKTEILRFLLSCGFNPKLLKRASNYAWKVRDYESLCELISADSPFPNGFKENLLSSDEIRTTALKALIDQRQKLHEQIKSNNLEDVKSLIRQHPKIKNAYNASNKCALTTAWESKSLETFAYLRSQGFSKEFDYTSEFGFLDKKQKERLRDCNLKYNVTIQNIHIHDILAKSRLGPGSDPKNSHKIEIYFKALDEISELRPILKVVANDKIVQIIFDFNRASVDELDPSKNIYTRGTTYFLSGRIYIGAMLNSDAEVLGTLAHEMMHYAMQLVYGNKCKPFHENDAERRQVFEKIVRDYTEPSIRSQEEIIDLAFINQSFDVQIAELIVRVPHLLALYKRDERKIKMLREKFKALFDFFDQETFKDLDVEYPVMKAENGVKELNQFLGNVEEFKNSNVFCSFDKMKDDSRIDSSYMKDKSILISSTVPSVVIANIYQSFERKKQNNFESSFIIVKAEQIIDQKHSLAIKKSFYSVKKPILLVVNPAGNNSCFDEVIKAVVEMHIKKRLIFVTSGKICNVFFNKILSIDYQWDDLSPQSQKEILSYEFNLQGTRISLNTILSSGLLTSQEFTLADILKLKDYTFNSYGDHLSSNFKLPFHIRRKFIKHVDQAVVEFESEQFLKEGETNRIVIIADVAGKGKSTTLYELSQELKHRNPFHWVAFIDLKDHTNSYKTSRSTEINHNFFSEKLLNINDSVLKKLFKHFYESGKFILLLDGFDEISPTYKSFALQLIKCIEESLQNQLWITTRMHFASELEDNLHETAFHLIPFSFDDQVQFLVEFWSLKDSNTKEIGRDKLKRNAVTILENFRESARLRDNDDFFGTPLQVRMLAEIHEDYFSHPSEREAQKFNFFNFYNTFVDKMLEISLTKGELAIAENIKFRRSQSTLMEVLQVEALKTIFEPLLTHVMLPTIDEGLDNETIWRTGIISKNSKNHIEFIHLTLAEYVVADLMLPTESTYWNSEQKFFLKDLYLEVLLHEKHERIRKILNDKLEVTDVAKLLALNTLTSNMEEILEVEGNCQILHLAIMEGNCSLVNFLFTTLRLNESTKLLLIQHRNSQQDMTLHIAARFGTVEVFECIWRISCLLLPVPREKLLFQKGLIGENVLMRSTTGQSLSVLKRVLQIAEKILNPSEFKSLLIDRNRDQDAAIHLATVCQNPKIFETFWSSIHRKLSIAEQGKLFFEKGYNGYNLLFRPIENVSEKALELILEEAQQLSKSEIDSLIFSESFFIRTAYVGTKPIFLALWNFLHQTLDVKVQKSLWQQKDHAGRNLLDEAVHNEDEQIVEEIVAISRNLLGDAFPAFLVEKDFAGLAAINYSMILGKAEVFEVLWKAISETMSIGNQKQQLRAIKNQPQSENKPFVDIIQEISRKLNVDDEDLNVAPETAVTFKEEYQHIDVAVFQNLLEFIISEGNWNSQQFLDLLNAKSPNDDTALYIALAWGRKYLIQTIFHLMRQKLYTDQQKSILFTKGFRGKTILGSSAENFDISVIKIVWAFTCEVLNPEDIKKLLHETDIVGKNFFHQAASCNNPILIESLEWVKIKLGRDELENFFCAETNDNSILFQIAAQFCDQIILSFFLNFVMINFDEKYCKNMFLSRGNEGYNSLGYLAHNSICQSVEIFWRNAQIVLGLDDDLEQLVFDKNDNSRMSFEYGERRKRKSVGEMRKNLEKCSNRRISKMIKKY